MEKEYKSSMLLFAFLLSLFAGLATSLGGLLALSRKVLERAWLATALAFAAGAMLFVSFVQIIPNGILSLQDAGVATTTANLIVFATFFLGALFVGLIDRLIPKSINPSEIEGREKELSASDRRVNKKLLRSGLLVAIALGLHNFPEGMSTFFATYQDINAGVALAVAIAIHNIPEGIAVAAPVYAATKSRRKALIWATISGLTEPLGALVALLLINLFVPSTLIGVVFGFVAGMMVFISIDELLPAAQRYKTGTHQVVYGVLGGMAVVAMSLLIV